MQAFRGRGGRPSGFGFGAFTPNQYRFGARLATQTVQTVVQIALSYKSPCHTRGSGLKTAELITKGYSMKPLRFFSLGVFALLSVLFAGFLLAQDKKEAKPGKGAPAISEEEMTKRWMAAATPGAAHKALDSQAGEWDLTTKAWMPGVDAPTESKGKSSTKWILGDRFLQSDVTGEMMGMPMTGLGITGYDNFKKKYVTFWIDSLGTAMYTAEGTFDAAGKVFTYHGKMDEPATGEKDKPVKFVHRVLSADKHVFEIHDVGLGAKSKVMEMTYTRKK